MKRRLRKKKHIGEFQELGFEILAYLHKGLSSQDFDAFLDRWLEAVEARQLAFCGGGIDGTFEGFVTRSGRGTASDQDRATLAAFLARDVAVTRHEVRELCDAWYGPG